MSGEHLMKEEENLIKVGKRVMLIVSLQDVGRDRKTSNYVFRTISAFSFCDSSEVLVMKELHQEGTSGSQESPGQ